MIATSATGEVAHIDGGSLGATWAFPFAALLLSIAVLPLIVPQFWHHHFGKVTFFWALVFLVPYTALFGIDAAGFAVIHTAVAEYIPFIALLFALYVVSGGVYVEGNIKGSPAVNASFLALGTA